MFSFFINLFLGILTVVFAIIAAFTVIFLSLALISFLVDLIGDYLEAKKE